MTGQFVLIICDGWGDSPDEFGNAIAAARTPALDTLRSRWPHTVVRASGEAVGLPPGQQGNSEVGHLTIGSGRVIFQPLSRINRAIADGSFYENEVLIAAVDEAKRRGRPLHCMGLVSPGGVHSHQAHAVALAELARRRGLRDLYVHAFTDGRDEPPTSALEYMRAFVAALEGVGVGRVVSMSGRYYGMDRDNRWERVHRAYTAIMGVGPHAEATDPVAYIADEYARGVTDEFIEPVVLGAAEGRHLGIQSGDVVVGFNFRPDRARELCHAIVDRNFTGFARPVICDDVMLVTYTEYEGGLTPHVVFPRVSVTDTLAEVVSGHGLGQFHAAETEKYAHVTYFINGGREQSFPGEARLLVQSPKVATYDTIPAMSAEELTGVVIDRLRSADDALVIVNFANTDMVGHTGDFASTVQAVEVVDRCIGQIADVILQRGGALLVTADHGNAELKIDGRDGSPLTAHTTNPVPVVLCGIDAVRLRDGGGLADVAPTVLEAMGLPVPPVMTGLSLLVR